MMRSLPCIDIAGLWQPGTPAHDQAVATIGAACRSTGFFAITGHGISPAQFDDAFAAAHELFALPDTTKQALALAHHGGNRGYVGLAVEALDERAAPDLKEAYNLVWTDAASPASNVWPPLAGWRSRAQEYFDAVLAVGRQLHHAFALDLGLPIDFFANKLDRPQATLRFLHYPVVFAADTPAGQAGAGEHTDYGNVTLLATDGVAGLQVRRRDGQWLNVPALSGAFICNIGDCLMRWTNDVYVSTPHRVAAPRQERYSIAFFLDPNPEALVAAIPSCVPAGQAPRYAPTTAAEYLQQRFSATYAAPTRADPAPGI